MRYDYKELKEFLLPDHRWVYFSIRVLRTNGWLYFAISFFPVLGTFMLSDQSKTPWTVTGHFILALAAGFTSLKAYRSQSPTDLEQLHGKPLTPEERASQAQYEKYHP